MSITIKNGELENVLQAVIHWKKKVKVALVRLKFLDIQEELRGPYENFIEIKEGLIKEFGEDGQIREGMDNWEAFVEQYEPVMNVENDFDIEPIPWEDIEDYEPDDQFETLVLQEIIARPE